MAIIPVIIVLRSSMGLICSHPALACPTSWADRASSKTDREPPVPKNRTIWPTDDSLESDIESKSTYRPLNRTEPCHADIYPHSPTGEHFRTIETLSDRNGSHLRRQWALVPTKDTAPTEGPSRPTKGPSGQQRTLSSQRNTLSQAERLGSIRRTEGPFRATWDPPAMAVMAFSGQQLLGC